MSAARFIPSPCPFCKCACVGGGDAMPDAGDASLCFACGEVSAFDGDLILRKPTDDELLKFYTDREVGPLLKRAQLEIKTFHANRKEGKENGTPSNEGN